MSSTKRKPAATVARSSAPARASAKKPARVQQAPARPEGDRGSKSASPTKKAKPGGKQEKLVKIAGKIPSEIPTLSRWLADDPKARLEEVKENLLKVGKDRFAKLSSPVRI